MKDEVIVLKDGEWNNAIEIPVLAKIDTIRIHALPKKTNMSTIMAQIITSDNEIRD
jgi:hypothetical protein